MLAAEVLTGPKTLKKIPTYMIHQPFPDVSSNITAAYFIRFAI